jgi:type IV pilus assembly protein PilA
MSTLNSRLQFSVLNRKKGKNLAEKGFTLIELLITVVILGTLSAIALPNFINQSDKAKIEAANAEATAKARACIQEKILDSTNICSGPFLSTVNGMKTQASAAISGTQVNLTAATM